MEKFVEAWIDVGGTFTDCLVRTAQGKVLRAKTLSSGRVPLSSPSPLSLPTLVGERQLRCDELASDCDLFWESADLIGLDEAGNALWTRSILSFKSGGALRLDQPIPQPATRFEIDPHCEAPVLAVKRLLQIPLTHSLPPLTVRLGTTRGTNALLTRSGAKVALLVTQPFQQLLDIGDQTRPNLFALNIVKPQPLASLSLGIKERLRADGSVLEALDVEHARAQLSLAIESGCESIAISLMHSYKNPNHELQLSQLAYEYGAKHVSVSHQLASLVELVARTQTTVVDAYLSPIVRKYFRLLSDQFGGDESVDLLVMTSAGGLVDWRDYSGKDCILSGPAGGVVALSQLQNDRKSPIIGLDMGGTSTDVCRATGLRELQFESTKAGVRILTPTLPIETVASGGGSVCWFDGVSLRVGPQSAGAYPGPACYGRGGPLTITDLNVASGRVPLEQFPFPIDLQACESRIDQLLDQIQLALGHWTREQLIEGFRRLANEQMAEAVRTVSIQQGIDPRQHALVGFGGAAGQHICEIAELLGINQVIDHPDAGLLSAVGMGLATLRLDHSIPVYRVLELVEFEPLLSQGKKTAETLLNVLQRGPTRQTTTDLLSDIQFHYELRYQGTDATLLLQHNESRHSQNDSIAEDLSADFASVHLQRYGYQRPRCSIELVSLRVSVVSKEKRDIEHLKFDGSQPEHVPQSSIVQGNHNLQSTLGQENLAGNVAITSIAGYPIFHRHQLRPGQRLRGPAIVLNFGSTLTVGTGWQREVDASGMLCLNRDAASLDSIDNTQDIQFAQQSGGFDPVLRDCYAQRLSAIATQMGHVLQQTAISVNIKQRRDYSCAVFDREGRLLANAPHVPVHLGSMGETVRAILKQFPLIRPGDSFLCNDPYCGGSHLPDLTVVLPIFAEDSDTPALFVANRAHHADIGGVAPGSMSIQATRLEEEGVVIAPFLLTDRGESQLEQLRQFVLQAKYPPRNWLENESDLYAQQAACQRGKQLIEEYAQQIGWGRMLDYANHLLDAGQARVEAFLSSELSTRCGLGFNTSLYFGDCLEDGSKIAVNITQPSHQRLKFDFSNCGSVSTSNLNANPSIVTAAVMYVLRCIIDDELPLNEGVLRAVELVIPQSILNPSSVIPHGRSPAVAAGNVETSQRVVDVLLGALGVAAASQGTMNNLLFGNSRFGFYETICGGAGATATANGASAVHTHMTNTRLTDPEVLEVRYPVRLVDFRIRAGSGGSGRTVGGDGVIRSFEFLEPVTLSLLTSRRASGPFGLAGGSDGMCGENWLQLPDADPQLLPAACQIEIPAGSIVTLKTPGGGGFGPSANK